MEAIEWTWNRIAGCIFAAAVVLDCLVTTGELNRTAAIAFGFLVLLGMLFWPEEADRMHRQSSDGFSHSGGEPTPGIILQIVVWLVMLTLGIIPMLLRWPS
ncbi:hypothetical protein AB1L30_02860 [Bremerella sp. JC817]|uniref:hypothetical protein n=1 Tax=Bremerella sp. JC817 TaxID=3231756 RepID=UPI00345B3F18